MEYLNQYQKTLRQIEITNFKCSSKKCYKKSNLIYWSHIKSFQKLTIYSCKSLAWTTTELTHMCMELCMSHDLDHNLSCRLLKQIEDKLKDKISLTIIDINSMHARRR